MSKKDIFEQLLREAHELDFRKERLVRFKSKCEKFIRDEFGDGSLYLIRLRSISFSPRGIRVNNQPPSQYPFIRGKQELEKLLQEIIETLDMAKDTSDNKTVDANEGIFIVHGHDEGMKQEVARFIEKIGLSPIILNEQASTGNTIIEKLEHYSSVGFAIILLSPCDEGRKHGSRKWHPRARQNVIVEMGYFVGKIGRNRVCILKKSDVEEPSDFSGVVYTPYDDNNGWKFSLCKELKAAGYSIDANEIL